VQASIDSPDSLLASFASGNESGKLIILTGHSGAGKTTWCMELVHAAGRVGISPVGLISPAVLEGGKKTGIDLRDLQSGTQRRLAVRRDESGRGQVAEEWLMDEETLRWGNALLGQREYCRLFILDELGPLEWIRGTGLTNGISRVAERNYGLACVVIRLSLLGQATEAWPWGRILHVPEHEAESEKGR
jgi:nucleoside-triphosphatase THEP1